MYKVTAVINDSAVIEFDAEKRTADKAVVYSESNFVKEEHELVHLCLFDKEFKPDTTVAVIKKGCASMTFVINSETASEGSFKLIGTFLGMYSEITVTERP